MPDTPRDPASLQDRLERLDQAIAPSKPSTKLAAPTQPERSLRPAAAGGMALGLALLAVAVATGHVWLVAPAVLAVILGGALMLRGVGDAVLSSLPTGLVQRDPTRAHVGMGATIAADAVIEPGATVEMGATVGAGARICRGAVVKMGATVGRDAVIEEAAIVGWGVDVHESAVVGKNAVVGAGCDIKAGARVPDGMRLMPGTDWSTRANLPAPVAPAIAAPTDPRVARVEVACARIEAELAQASPQLRELLGAPAETALALRQTCLRLLERERALRAECSPEALQLLDQEKAALQQRIDASDDPSVKQSLQSAVAAIDDQRRSRGQLQKSADRMDAELTRLSWTLDGMGAQLVRLRSAGQDAAGAPDAAALEAMQQLHAEIDAIAQALEEVAQGDRPRPELAPISEVSSASSASVRARERG